MSYYEVRGVDLAARIAKLRTKSGVVETPYLFPVVDPARQEVDLGTIESLGFIGVITNAYLFYRRKRGEVIDIHRAINWDKVLMTDSGGYQILTYGDIEVDNRDIVLYQKNVGSDIGVILDVPTGSHMDVDQALAAVEETFKRALEVLPIIQDSNTLWVLPLQGAPHKELVAYSSIRSWRYPYHINALGSPTVLLEKYKYSIMIEIVALTRLYMPPNKPLHVFGVGHPMIIPFLVALGADLFDSASYILYARDGRYMTSNGTKRIDELSYLPCACSTCSKYSPRELLELPKDQFVKELALHNLHKISEELRRVKQAIVEGRLWEYIEEKKNSHPSLREAFEVLKKYINLLMKYTPRSKTPVHSLLISDYESRNNPKVIRFKHDAEEFLWKPIDKVILLPAIEKPYGESAIIKSIPAEIASGVDVDNLYFYHPILGVFPALVSNTYPLFQHEEPDIMQYPQSMCIELLHEVMRFIDRAKPKEVILLALEEIEWSKCLGELLSYRGLHVHWVRGFRAALQ
ncbi:MAG: tRNA guanosine(15) transglycosylase TgtA [Sulfolobales archaeon]|nr:tRNA guanosine(15) transglycosylase TgtA [Sulfolobales archaeon]